MVVKFKVVLKADGRDGGFVAICPALPGCASQGETEAEAVANIREAIEGVLLVMNAKAHARRTEHIVEIEV